MLCTNETSALIVGPTVRLSRCWGRVVALAGIFPDLQPPPADPHCDQILRVVSSRGEDDEVECLEDRSVDGRLDPALAARGSGSRRNPGDDDRPAIRPGD